MDSYWSWALNSPLQRMVKEGAVTFNNNILGGWLLNHFRIINLNLKEAKNKIKIEYFQSKFCK